MTMPLFNKGESFTVQRMVEKKDTGAHIGSGKLDQLLASPMLLDMMIDACARLIDKRLPEEMVSVGVSYQIQHVQPTLVGEMLTCKVSLIEHRENKLKFSMEAYDETGLVGTGSCERYIVNQEALIQKARKRIETMRLGVNV